jgi:acyl dehydratase
MTLCYSLRDAERWAAFSGDDNPIHFDATEAKRFGWTAYVYTVCARCWM